MSLELPLVLQDARPLDRVACAASTAFRLAEMIVKSESPPLPVTTKSFHLSHLDQNAVRVYIQTLCIFPVSILALATTVSEIFTDQILCSSQIRTRARLPFTLSIGGCAVP